CADGLSRPWVFSFLAAGGEEAGEGGGRLPLHGVVDVPLFLPALHQPGPAESIQMMGEGRPGDLHRGLDLADGNLPSRPHEVEEHLEAREMAQRLEGFDMRLVGLQLLQGETGYGFHISKPIELSKESQAVAGTRRGSVDYSGRTELTRSAIRRGPGAGAARSGGADRAVPGFPRRGGAGRRDPAPSAPETAWRPAAWRAYEPLRAAAARPRRARGESRRASCPLPPRSPAPASTPAAGSRAESARRDRPPRPTQSWPWLPGGP